MSIADYVKQCIYEKKAIILAFSYKNTKNRLFYGFLCNARVYLLRQELPRACRQANGYENDE